MAVYLGVSITQNSQSIANNTSNVTVRVYCSWTGGSYNAQTAPDGLPQARGWLNVDGARYNFYSYFNTGRTSSGSQTLFTKTLDIEHNAEGIKTLTCSASYATGVSSGTLSASNSLKLTDIPRYARLEKAPDFTDESNPTIQYVNPAGAIASSVRAGIALMNNTVVVAYRDLDITGTSYTFNLTESERNTLRFATPTSNELKVQFLIETVIGGVTGINSLASTMSIVNANPAVSPVIRDTNSVTLNVTQDASVLVALRSIAQVTINAVAQKGATIQTQQVVQGNKVLDGDGSFLVSNANPIYIEVVDSRGNTTTVQAPNSIVPYIEPTCLIEQVRPDGTGEIPLTIIGKVYNGAIGRAKNNVVVQYRNKVGYGQYSAWHTIGSVELSDNNFTAFIEITGLDYKARHTLQARVIDILNADGVLSAEAIFIAIPVFEWGSEDFQFNVPVSLNGNKITELATPTDAQDAVNKTYVDTNFAPTGYGLGKNAKAISDLNQALKCGWYCYGSTAINTPFGYGAAMTINRYDTGYVQLAFDVGLHDAKHNGAIAKRVHNGTVWSNWEYINPPMHLGVEYRTTERYNGAPVYTKMIEFGTLFSSGVASVPTGLSNVTYIGYTLRVPDFATEVVSGTAMFSEGKVAAYAWIDTTTNEIKIRSSQDCSNYQAFVTIKYCKN